MVTAIMGVLIFPFWWYSGVPPKSPYEKEKNMHREFWLSGKHTNEMKNNEIIHIPAGLFTPNPYL